RNISLYRSIAGVCTGAAMLMVSDASAQNLFVGDYASNSILKFSNGTESVFATGLNYPTGLAFDSSGNLFEGDQFSGHIYEWAGTGSARTTFASGLNQPGAMAFNATGDLFVIVNGEVDEFSPTGVIMNTITGLSQASGLAFDGAGNLYISNINGGAAGKGFITEVTPKGVQSTFASGLNYPFGMAFNAAGDLFVANANGFNTVTEITPAGAENLFASNLNGSGEIAFDQSGDMFVGDAGLNNGLGDITEFSANGTRTVFATGIRPMSLAFQGETLPVPEPSVDCLAGLGFIAMGVMFACRRGKKTPAKV
ncbi:MAG TPA: PEP-CTERM sorting domain-containing protein, partial [Verrucomicrobiae bacterium]|nr:PEP-CTERM sorting domain-containing protein [Verrucomicrobiae bacterium]